MKSCYKTYYHIFEASNDGLRTLLHGKFHTSVNVYLKVTLIPKISKMKQTHSQNQPSSQVAMAVALAKKLNVAEKVCRHREKVRQDSGKNDRAKKRTGSASKWRQAQRDLAVNDRHLGSKLREKKAEEIRQPSRSWSAKFFNFQSTQKS